MRLMNPSSYTRAMRAKTKNGFPPKVCQRCEREFEWRKKWARDWENVKYCSEKCKAEK
jgi:hypothetical protein